MMQLPSARRRQATRADLILFLSVFLLFFGLVGFQAIAASRSDAYEVAPAVAALSGTITVADGTSGLGLEQATEAFTAQAPGITVSIEHPGREAAIRHFCAGEVDLATGDRFVQGGEATTCTTNKVAYAAFQVAIDGAGSAHPKRLTLYVARASLVRPEVAEFLRLYFAGAADFVAEAGVTPLESYSANRSRLEDLIAGRDQPMIVPRCPGACS